MPFSNHFPKSAALFLSLALSAGLLSHTACPSRAQSPSTPASPTLGQPTDPAFLKLVERGDALFKTAAWSRPDFISDPSPVNAPLFVDGTLVCPVAAANGITTIGVDPATGKNKWDNPQGLALPGDHLTTVTVMAMDHSMKTINAASGAEKWHADLSPVLNQLGTGDGKLITVAVNLIQRAGTGVRVAVPNGPPELRAYDCATGNLKWTYPLPDDLDNNVISIVAGDVVCVRMHHVQLTLTPNGPLPPPAICVLDSATGKLIRQIDLGDSPGIPQLVKDGLLIATGTSDKQLQTGQIAAYDLKTGNRKWIASINFDILKDKPNIRAFHAINAVVPGGNFMLVNFVARLDTPNYLRGIVAMDLLTGKQHWLFTDNYRASNVDAAVQFGFTPPAIHKNILVTAVGPEFLTARITDRQGFLALNPNDGQPLWFIRTDAVCKPPVIASGILYALITRAPQARANPPRPAGLFAIPLDNNPLAQPAP